MIKSENSDFVLWFFDWLATRDNLTRLQGLCSTVEDDETVGPLFIIDCESCMGFIGGGSSKATSSSASRSACVTVSLWPLCDVTLADVVGIDLYVANGSSSAVVDVDNLSANLNVFSEPFFTSGRSATVVLSTFPWDSFRSGVGSHLRLENGKITHVDIY